MVEFFFFAMREAALASGQGDAMGGLKQFFQGWDRKEAFTRGFVSGDPRYEGGDGKLDRDEFNTLAAGLGFGAVATQLLEAIDTDGSVSECSRVCVYSRGRAATPHPIQDETPPHSPHSL